MDCRIKSIKSPMTKTELRSATSASTVSSAKSGMGIQARRLFQDFTEPVIGPATLGRTRWFNRGYVCARTILPMSLLDWFEL
jgi:hypothetical protein